ncbi:MAG: DNA polymerase ligase N-terminal domain-containing protein [Thermoguttaceae bacterium]
MPRFTILRHDNPQGLHWDLLLETGPVLKTWALPQPPEPGAEMIATALPDHRPLYLDYQGPISQGRGTVSRWDRGTWQGQLDSSGQWSIDLAGERFCGRASFQAVPGQAGAWQVCFTDS